MSCASAYQLERHVRGYRRTLRDWRRVRKLRQTARRADRLTWKVEALTCEIDVGDERRICRTEVLEDIKLRSKLERIEED